MIELPADGFVLMRPAALWGLAALPVLAWWLLRRSPDRAWDGVVHPELRAHMIDPGSGGGTAGPAWPWLAAWVLACVALAGPSWRSQPASLLDSAPPRVAVVALDGAMRALDPEPDRTVWLRLKLAQWLDEQPPVALGLVAYAGTAHVVTPPTHEPTALRRLVDVLDPGLMPVDGHDPAAAMQLALGLLDGGDGGDGGRIVVFAVRADEATVAAARRAARRGIRVDVIGMGTPEGGPVGAPGGGLVRDARGDVVLSRRDDDALARLAAAGGGRYRPMSVDASDLAALGLLRSAQAGVGGAPLPVRRDDGALLLPLVMVLALLGWRRWRRLALVVGCLLLLNAPAGEAEAAEPFRRADQRAWLALAEGDFQRAAALARDPALEGVARFRLGDAAGAESAFARVPGAMGHYNRGNALAAQARYPDAIAAWRQALEVAPDHEAARANIQAVEAWLQQTGARPTTDTGDADAGGGDGEGEGQSQVPGEAPEQGDPGDGTGDSPAERSDDDVAGTDATADAAGGSRPGADEAGQGPPAADPVDEAGAARALAEAIDAALQDGVQAGAHEADDPGPQDGRLDVLLDPVLRSVEDDPAVLLRRRFLIEQRRQTRREVD
ncbi:MAG: tetratricopeptide repeat protein [Lysobacteraceae bacterium]